MGERGKETVRLKERTASSFGFEWTKFSGIYDSYESNFLSYVKPLDKEFFKDKEVLDAGCGAGRHAHFMAKYGAKVTAFDLSQEAVQVTQDNAWELSGLEAVCADIYNLPEEWVAKFDCAVVIGVLHHLPDPQEGFRQLVRTLKPGGKLVIWVYGRKDNALAQVVYEPLRRITTRIPHKILYWAALAPALAVEMANRLKLPIFRHYAVFPFRTKWNDSFDVLSAPKSRYYDLEDIRWWFNASGLNNVSVDYRVLNGKAKGIIGIGDR